MGLLTPGAFGKSSLDKKPKKVGGGLLQPVVLEKLGQQKFPTEGGGGGVRSFGKRGTARSEPGGWETTTAPGRGEVRVKQSKEEGWTPRFVNLAPKRPGEASGRHRDTYTTVDTPSGQTVRFDQWAGSGKTSVTFGLTNYPLHGARPADFAKTTNTFGEVLKTLKAYKNLYNPSQFRYYGATDAHQRLYDKASPQLAKGLGAVHSRDGRYHILTFPDAD